MSIAGSNVDILAALDAAKGSDTEAVVTALNKLHSQKVRTLMKSINDLKDKVIEAERAGASSRQSKMVQSLRSKLREQELVADVLKAEVVNLKQCSKEEVNALVIAKTCGGPKRFRPKTREELQNELLLLLLLLAAAAAHGATAAASADAECEREIAQFAAVHERRTVSAGAVRAEQSIVDPAELSALMEELETLKMAVNAKDTALERQAQEAERLRSDNRSLRQSEERLAHKERRATELKAKNTMLAEKLAALVTAQESAQEEAQHLRAQLHLHQEEAKVTRLT
eukprot:3590-Heterococcus_DN1.PRE.2